MGFQGAEATPHVARSGEGGRGSPTLAAFLAEGTRARLRRLAPAENWLGEWVKALLPLRFFLSRRGGLPSSTLS